MYGQPFRVEFNLNDAIGIIARVDKVDIRVSDRIFTTMESVRATIYDLGLIMSTRKFVRDLRESVAKMFQPYLRGQIGLTRAEQKEFVNSTTKLIAPWLRMKGSINWVENLRHADDLEFNERDHYIKALEKWAAIAIYSKESRRFYSDIIDIGTGVMDTPRGFHYLIASDGRPAVATRRGEDLGQAVLREVDIKDISDPRTDKSMPFRLKTHAFGARVRFVLDDGSDRSVDHDINSFYQNVESTASYDVVVRAGISDVRDLSTQPRQMYATTLLKVPYHGIEEITDHTFNTTPPKIRSWMIDRMEHIDVTVGRVSDII
jgi:hypothetical protein